MPITTTGCIRCGHIYMMNLQLRYGKDHKSYVVLKDLLRDPPKNITPKYSF